MVIAQGEESIQWKIILDDEQLKWSGFKYLNFTMNEEGMNNSVLKKNYEWQENSWCNKSLLNEIGK